MPFVITSGAHSPMMPWPWSEALLPSRMSFSVIRPRAQRKPSIFTGTPGNPKAVPAAATGYSTGADPGGALPGSNLWNLKPPDGAIMFGDIGAVVAQFGHAGCNPK